MTIHHSPPNPFLCQLTPVLKRIYFTVTNDLTYDQRMHRICGSLAHYGYKVILVGRKLSNSLPLKKENFEQRRLNCWFNRGKLFYAEYQLRLFFFLLIRKMDAICAIDLDTIYPCLYISRLKKIPRIYDAHELFTELKEVVTRPGVRKTWMAIEKKAVPQFSKGYTVSESIAEEFHRRYGVNYNTIRNVPVLKHFPGSTSGEKFLLYSGAVNEARAFEQLVPAMREIECKLVVCGDGNFMRQLKSLIRDNQLDEKIELKGMLPPEDLWKISTKAYIGLGVAENTGLNQYLALPNKFFDYIHAGLPQVAMNYPEYKKINRRFEVALLINNISSETIAQAINNLLQNDVLYMRLRENCLKARKELNWQQEENRLLEFYKSVLGY